MSSSSKYSNLCIQQKHDNIVNEKEIAKREKCLQDIHQFYSKKCVKRQAGLPKEMDKISMDQHEFIGFARDYQIKVSLSLLKGIFKLHMYQKALNLQQFVDMLPNLGLQYSKSCTIEIKYCLQQIKNVLEYPKARIDENIEKLINDFEEPAIYSKSIQLYDKKPLPIVIPYEEINDQKAKAKQIMKEIQKIMTQQGQLAEQQTNKDELNEIQFELNMHIPKYKNLHPLYVEYKRLLNEFLPKYEKIQTAKQGLEMMYSVLGLKINLAQKLLPKRTENINLTPIRQRLSKINFNLAFQKKQNMNKQFKDKVGYQKPQDLVSEKVQVQKFDQFLHPFSKRYAISKQVVGDMENRDRRKQFKINFDLKQPTRNKAKLGELLTNPHENSYFNVSKINSNKFGNLCRTNSSLIKVGPAFTMSNSPSIQSMEAASPYKNVRSSQSILSQNSMFLAKKSPQMKTGVPTAGKRDQEQRYSLQDSMRSDLKKSNSSTIKHSVSSLPQIQIYKSVENLKKCTERDNAYY